jgi:hypothetical protein
MRPHLRFTALFWAIGNLIDDGRSEDLDVIQTKIEDGTLFDYLDHKYPDADLSLLSEEDRASLLRFFLALVQTVDHRRKFGVDRNGLVLLVAYAMEGVQQSVDSSHELNI